MSTNKPPWLLFLFSLSAKRASLRVEVWRRLRRYGTLALKNSGYVLPNRAANEERFQWLAEQVRRVKGDATVVQVEAFDNLPEDVLTREFVSQTSKEYAALAKEFQRTAGKAQPTRAQQARLRKRFQEIVERDFFGSPQRGKVEELLAKMDESQKGAEEKLARSRKEYRKCIWVTRCRPGIDRVASAWLIRRFIDQEAVFVFADNSTDQPSAIPFDMFCAEGFGHRGEDCTFETLLKAFTMDDPRVLTIAKAVHDADLGDEKFGRVEALGLDRVLTGWAQQGISDAELLRRGIELIEGLYQAL
jgi:hypothetical protein